MKIKIYQINMNRDTERVAFESLEFLERRQGNRRINSSIYDRVYEGELDCNDLERVFEKFNFEHPEDYRGRSMSVSDIVEVVDSPEIVGIVKTGDGERSFTDFLEYTAFQNLLRDQGRDFETHDYIGFHKHLIEPGFYFCDSFGFKKVEFDPESVKATQKDTDKIRVVLLEPGKVARITEISRTLADMQNVVHGDIEAFYPFEEEVCIVCNA